MKIIYRYDDSNRKQKLKELIKPIMSKNLIIIGIGTDLVTGDCLGPLVAQFVKESTELQVLGAFGDLVTAKNVASVQASLDKSKYAIAIDSTLSRDGNDYIEDIIYRDKGIKPGSGVGKDLPRTGTHTIAGVVHKIAHPIDVHSFTELPIRLGIVYSLARTISEAIIECYQEVVVSKQE